MNEEQKEQFIKAVSDAINSYEAGELGECGMNINAEGKRCIAGQFLHNLGIHDSELRIHISSGFEFLIKDIYQELPFKLGDNEIELIDFMQKCFDNVEEHGGADASPEEKVQHLVGEFRSMLDRYKLRA